MIFGYPLQDPAEPIQNTSALKFFQSMIILEFLENFANPKNTQPPRHLVTTVFQKKALSDKIKKPLINIRTFLSYHFTNLIELELLSNI